MPSFSYQRAKNPAAAVQALSAAASSNSPFTEAESLPLAGGTTLIDLMKLEVMRPRMLVDINPLASQWSAIDMSTDHLRLGAMARMSDVADNVDVQRHYPVIAEALKLAASQQIRNMATLGGNVLQRTRCSYFRADWRCRLLTVVSTCSAWANSCRPWAVSRYPPACRSASEQSRAASRTRKRR
jgi:xanthine dehydrogenase YagS FAD-binding subunit